MTLPDGERLLITIDRKVEVQCDNVTCSIKVPDIYKEWQKCPTCHGTGRITKRVRGWCEVEDLRASMWDGTKLYEVIPRPEGRCSGYYGSLKEIRCNVLSDYLDGSLPDEIAANIEMEDV